MRILFACFVAVFCAVTAQAQTIPPPVLVIDSENLYQTTEFSRQLRQGLLEEQQALAAENSRLVDSLRAEELRLTELRKTLSPEDFTKAAEEFDERVQTARRIQEEKTQDAEARLAEQRQIFFRRIRPIVGQIMVERGATLVLDENAGIFMRFNVLDITNIARERIDAELAKPSP